MGGIVVVELHNRAMRSAIGGEVGGENARAPVRAPASHKGVQAIRAVQDRGCVLATAHLNEPGGAVLVCVVCLAHKDSVSHGPRAIQSAIRLSGLLG